MTNLLDNDTGNTAAQTTETSSRKGKGTGTKVDKQELQRIDKAVQECLSQFASQVKLVEKYRTALQMAALGMRKASEYQQMLDEFVGSPEFAQELKARRAKRPDASPEVLSNMKDSIITKMLREKLKGAVRNLTPEDRRTLQEKYSELVFANVSAMQEYSSEQAAAEGIQFPLFSLKEEEPKAPLVGDVDFLEVPSQRIRVHGKGSFSKHGTDPFSREYHDIHKRYLSLCKAKPSESTGKSGDVLYSLLSAEKKPSTQKIPGSIPVIDEPTDDFQSCADVEMAAYDLYRAARIPMDLGLSSAPIIDDPAQLEIIKEELENMRTDEVPEYLVFFPDYVQRDAAWSSKNQTEFLTNILTNRGWRPSQPMVFSTVGTVEIKSKPVSLVLVVDGGQRIRTLISMFSDEVAVVYGTSPETSDGPAKVKVKYSTLLNAKNPAWVEAAHTLRDFNFDVRVHTPVSVSTTPEDFTRAFEGLSDQDESQAVVAGQFYDTEWFAGKLFQLANHDNLRKSEKLKPAMGLSAAQQIRRLMARSTVQTVLQKVRVLPANERNTVLKGPYATHSRGAYIDFLAGIMYLSARQTFDAAATMSVQNNLQAAIAQRVPTYSKENLESLGDAMLEAFNLYYEIGQGAMEISRPGINEEEICIPFARMGMVFFTVFFWKTNGTAEWLLNGLSNNRADAVKFIQSYMDEVKKYVETRTTVDGRTEEDPTTSMKSLMYGGTNNASRLNRAYQIFLVTVMPYLEDKMDLPE